MKRNNFGSWQVVALFGVVGIVMVFAQRDKTPQAPASTPAPVLAQAAESYVTEASFSLPVDDSKQRIRFMVPTKPYVVPADGKNHEIRIAIATAEGSHDVYLNRHRGGEKVRQEVFLKRSERVRFYDNDALVGEARL